MTPKQRELLDYIEGYLRLHRYSPSFAEMVEAMGVASKSRVFKMTAALIEQGYLVRIAAGNRARNLVPARPELKAFSDQELRAELARRGEAEARAL